jgi:hypothetical protein
MLNFMRNQPEVLVGFFLQQNKGFYATKRLDFLVQYGLSQAARIWGFLKDLDVSFGTRLCALKLI